MAESNNRKRKLSSENTTLKYEDDVGKKENTNENGAVINVEVEPNLDTTSSTATKIDGTPLISKSTFKSFSRILPRNVAGTIGRKTSLLTRRTLRRGRDSLQNLNQGWDTLNTFSSLEDDGNTQGEATLKRKQTLRKNYTLKLKKLKEKFKTRRQLRKDRFRSLQTVSQDRFHKDLNQSKVENNKQNSVEVESDAILAETQITAATPKRTFVYMSEDSSSSSVSSASSSESNDYFSLLVLKQLNRVNLEMKRQLLEVFRQSERQRAVDEKFLEIFTRFVDNSIKFQNSLLPYLKK